MLTPERIRIPTENGSVEERTPGHTRTRTERGYVAESMRGLIKILMANGLLAAPTRECTRILTEPGSAPKHIEQSSEPALAADTLRAANYAELTAAEAHR